MISICSPIAKCNVTNFTIKWRDETLPQVEGKIFISLGIYLLLDLKQLFMGFENILDWITLLDVRMNKSEIDFDFRNRSIGIFLDALDKFLFFCS